MNEIQTIFLRKELRDIRGNPQVLPGYLILPALAIILPLAFLALAPITTVDRLDPDIVKLLTYATRDPALAGYPEAERLVRFIVREFGSFFLLMPVLLSGMSAALSVAAEKQQRTLEPLLATPINDRMFVMAKLAAAVAPATAVTWAAALCYGVGVAVLTAIRLDSMVVPGAAFWLTVGIAAPLGGAVAALMGMRVSIKAADVQSAVQASGLWVVPAGLLLIAFVGRPALRSAPWALVVIAVLGALSAWSFRRTVRRFEREEILTRWN